MSTSSLSQGVDLEPLASQSSGKSFKNKDALVPLLEVPVQWV